MHFHWQNLNELPTPPGTQKQRTGHPLRAGRAWWHLDNGRTFAFEWYLLRSFRHSVGFGVGQRGDDDGLVFHLAVPLLFAFYLTLPVRRRPYVPGWEPREVQVSFHDWALWWNLWTPSMSWSSKTPKWRNGSFHVDNFVLGSRKFSEATHHTEPARIPLPEGEYAAVLTYGTRRWKRPRWPFALVRHYTEVAIPDGLPYSGKGENAWDCGEDGLFGYGVDGWDRPKAIAAGVEKTLETRLKRGDLPKWRENPDARHRRLEAVRRAVIEAKPQQAKPSK